MGTVRVRECPLWLGKKRNILIVKRASIIEPWRTRQLAGVLKVAADTFHRRRRNDGNTECEREV
jgi:hypothetical protein